jgi:hypothetical protein
VSWARLVTSSGPSWEPFVVVALKEASLRFPIHHNLVLGIMLVAAVRLFPDRLAGATARFFERLGGLGRLRGRRLAAAMRGLGASGRKWRISRGSAAT